MKIELYNSDNLEIMAKMPDESVDVICIDPPYLYLKNQKLERAFDEKLFFAECRRLLTNDGFIVMFGRGESFYRWNTILADLKFTFKEEIVWNKRRATSPTHKLQRYHETISIFNKGDGFINKIKIPYLEAKENDIISIKRDIDRLSSALKNKSDFEDIIHYLNTCEIKKKKKQNNTTGVSVGNKSLNVMSVTPIYLRSIREGIVEKTIISITSEQLRIHPTQKPVRLLERLLKLVIPMKKDKIVIADWFAGSFSTCEAVINLQAEFPEKAFEFVGTEIDEEYFNLGKNRIDNIKPDLFKNV